MTKLDIFVIKVNTDSSIVYRLQKSIRKKIANRVKNRFTEVNDLYKLSKESICKTIYKSSKESICIKICKSSKNQFTERFLTRVHTCI